MGSRVRQEQTKPGALSHRQPASPARMDGGFSFGDMKRTSLSKLLIPREMGPPGLHCQGLGSQEGEEGDRVLIADWRQLDPNRDSPVLPAGA